MNDLETLQLPVLFKSEEAKAREILSACTSLKNIIISQSVGEDFDVKAPTLDPRLLFEGVPKNVSLFLRECACDISYLRQSGMLRGTLSRYDPTSQAFTQISVPTSYSQLIDVNYVLMDALVPRAQDPSLS